MKLDTKLPDWLAMPMRPGGGYGATICAHMLAGVEMTPCPFGPDKEDVELVRDADQLVLRGLAFRVRLRRSPRR